MDCLNGRKGVSNDGATFPADHEGVMSMPRYRAVVLAAACALALAAPASAAYAATAAPHAAAKPVLTVGKKGGPAVKKRAVLEASLAKGKNVVFALKTSLGTFTATCSRSALQAKVTANPSSRGKATLSLTKETISHCTLKGAPDGIKLNGIKGVNLPSDVTVSSAKGFPVTIAGRSKTKPVAFQASINASSVGAGTLTCVVTAPKVSGHASNKGNEVTVAKQKFTLDKSASSPDCTIASSATFSATYGPIRDTSVKHSPKVFVS
jgi:predicted RecA/RadA family phage recombinase